MTWIEEFAVWRKLGKTLPDAAGARQVEAFLILQDEISKEGQRCQVTDYGR